MSKGIFIVIEGPECSGKTTVAKELKVELEAKGHVVNLLLSHNAGPGTLSHSMRENILNPEYAKDRSDTATALLFAVARRSMIDSVIKPALECGEVVIVDRWVMSTLAIQRDCDNVDALNQIATAGVVPNITFVFDLKPEKTMERLLKRTEQQDVLDMVSEEEHKARYNVYMTGQLYPTVEDKYLTYLLSDENDVDWTYKTINVNDISIPETTKEVMDALIDCELIA